MIASFIKFLTGTGIRPVLAEFDVSAVRELIIHEQERGLSLYTVQGKVIKWKSFIGDKPIYEFFLPSVTSKAELSE